MSHNHNQSRGERSKSSSQYRKSGWIYVPKSPSSQLAATAKAPGDASSKSFPLQFRSKSPVFMNGRQISARTNSASPNLDERSITGLFPPQLQQQVFVPSVQPHSMQPQGIIHQGPSLNFTAQMVPPQIGNLGIGMMSPQFAQQQAGKFGTSRKTVKMTHPDTHEELRLGRRADTHMDGGSSGPRTHPNVPQSQPITSVPQTVSFMNPSAQNSHSNKNSTLMLGIAEPSSLEHSHDVCNAISSASLATEDINAGLVSLPAASSTDKTVLELSRSKSTKAKWKKKRKEILPKKGNSAGTTSDLYMACKGPEEKKETVASSSESLASTSSINSKQVLVNEKDDVVLSENGGQSKAEPDDLEDATDISTPKLDTVDDGKQAHGGLKHVGEDGNGVMAKKCSRDFLLKFRKQCTSLPEGFKCTSDSDRWQRATGFQKGLIPSPQTPLQVMHKAEKKYEVGKVTDEEEAKQRQLKAILNKLTPQNFEKLFEQVKAVNIDNDVALIGVISQIFDKALMEPTFCEMYANFCYHLARELPDFSVDNEKITFKRLLLNKCQEEFDRGEREQEEADRTDQEGEVKQSEEEREQKRIQARRRMLGNIRLIGELYKKKMLTERKMHECIQKLLGQYQNPDEEDIESLCKLMSTIGEMIDHPKAKEHIDAYFEMMAKLSNNMKLSSRVRFMLKDSIDLRKNKWQQRRKVEVLYKHVGEGTEDINTGLVSLPAAGSKDKPVLELSRSKSTVAKGKKKRKEILQKVDAAGTTSDLYVAYEGPEGKKETVASSESLASTSSISSKQVLVNVKDDVVLSENGGQSKAEPDDLEDAADISTPKLDIVDDGKLAHGGLKHLDEDGNGVMAKKYSRDFTLKFKEQCTSLPEGFKCTSDVNAGLVSLPAAGSKEKPVLELSRSKSTVAKGKKKRKEILQKVDAAGTTSDLYVAYEGPEGKKETDGSSESLASTSSISSKQVLVDVKDDVVLSENGGQSKAEPDDLEDAAYISTPKLDIVDDGKLAHGGLKHLDEDENGVMAKKYSRDFILKFREQCTSLSEGFKCTSDVNPGLVSLPAAGSKEKPVLELSRSKSTVAKGKKKRKEILQKVDAAGTTSDLYVAYEVPEGKKETVASSESLASTSSISSKQVLVDVKDDVVLSENGGQSKAEPDDLEDAADISTPKLDIVDDGKLAHGGLKHLDEDGNGVMAKQYSRDFTLKFKEQCTSLPEGFKCTSDVNAGLVSLPAAGSKEKTVLELSRSNSTVAKEKKKRKKNLQKKRNSAGTTSDLDMAYKGPEGKKETVASSESLPSTSSIKQVLVDEKDDVVLSENGGQSKVEPVDWEDATDISTPKLDTLDDGKQAHGGLKHVGEDGNGVMSKKYSRDFLLKFREQCTSLH